MQTEVAIGETHQDGGDGARHNIESGAKIVLGPRGRARVEGQKDCRDAVMSQSPSRDGGFGGMGEDEKRQPETLKVIVPALVFAEHQHQRLSISISDHLGAPASSSLETWTR